MDDLMLHNKLWVSNNITDNEIDKLSGRLGVSRLISRIFLSRGISDVHYIRSFLNPCLDDLHNPFLLKDMDKAVERIIKAINGREKILIYGDYDVDGVTSTSILKNFLSRLGADVQFYIPDRMDEGYGLSLNAIEKIFKMGISLIITVDCGISAIDEIKYINEKKIDVIVTDHHECKCTLPDAYAVINPCRHDCEYPFKELAGVGVAYKLVNALCKSMDLGDIYNDYLDLVALGTIADVVPLVGENRVIAKLGIPKIQCTNNLGLRTLIENCGLKEKKLTSFAVSFILAPRVNAAGRIGDAGRAVTLFTTTDGKEAFDISVGLSEENKFRQETEREIFQQAEEIIESKINLEKEKVLVIAGESWHHGVIGIVASRITEKYYRPSILISVEDGVAKGSGRSIEGFNIFKALCRCETFLDSYGGHELAAGLSLQADNIEKFRTEINSYADAVMTSDDLVPKVKIDSYIPKQDITIESIKQLEMLSPFGAGNQEPIFAYRGFRINGLRTVGDDKHLKLLLEDAGFMIDAIGFKMGHLYEAFNQNDMIDAAFALEINTWNSLQKIQINLKDIKPCEEVIRKNNYLYSLDKNIKYINFNGSNITDELLGNLKLTEIVPERRDLTAVYQHIRAAAKEDLIVNDLFLLAKKIANSYKICMNYFKLKKSIEIFEELRLLKTKPKGKYGLIIEINRAIKGKANLDSSEIYRKLQKLKRYRQKQGAQIIGDVN
jgi:single-stranded-DNA-specific exonuclease